MHIGLFHYVAGTQMTLFSTPSPNLYPSILVLLLLFIALKMMALEYSYMEKKKLNSKDWSLLERLSL